MEISKAFRFSCVYLLVLNVIYSVGEITRHDTVYLQCWMAAMSSPGSFGQPVYEHNKGSSRGSPREHGDLFQVNGAIRACTITFHDGWCSSFFNGVTVHLGRCLVRLTCQSYCEPQYLQPTSSGMMQPSLQILDHVVIVWFVFTDHSVILQHTSFLLATSSVDTKHVNLFLISSKLLTICECEFNVFLLCCMRLSKPALLFVLISAFYYSYLLIWFQHHCCDTGNSPIMELI